ncbi:hypothetical protein AB0M43_05300 [Longispora sp. NPDC051575]|uniref:hypothetical protein n=1 Tax=Longispora sp. NPDC051575 TaxID=3154943 RepID=UPI00343D800D
MRTRTHVTFGAALRAAIGDSGLTLHAVQGRLARRGVHVAIATLSSWQTGHNRPERVESIRAVTVLEELFDLDPGALTSLLGPRRSRGRHPLDEAGRIFDVMSNGLAIEEIVGEICPDLSADIQGLYLEEEVVLAAGRSLSEVGTRIVTEARSDGVDRAYAVNLAEPGTDLDAIHVVATLHCRVGRVRRNYTENIVGTELILDQSYNAGDSFVVEYKSVLNQPNADDEYFRAFTGTSELYVLRVRFDPAELPVRCYEFHAGHVDGPRTEKEIRLSSAHIALVAQRHPGLGVVGIRWEWE